MDDFLAKARELVLRYRDDPVLFVQEVLRPGKAISDQQRSLLSAMAAPGAKVSVRSGHGTGKTTTLAWLVLWFLCTWRNVKIPCTASTQSQLRDALWAEISIWRDRMPQWWKDQVIVTSSRVEIRGFEASQFAVARTSSRNNPDALQGFHAENILFILEEASGVFEKVFEVARGALSTDGARVVMCGNPTRTTGYFYESFNKNRNGWTTLQFNGEDSPHVSRQFIADMASEYGADSDIYRVRVQGNFPRASINQLIPEELVRAAVERTIRPEQYGFAPVIFGVDFAPYGGDRSAIYMRQGLFARKLWQGINVDDLTVVGIVGQIPALLERI